MQVATFFQDNKILMGSATAMNSTSESSFISLEERGEKTDESSTKDNTATTSNLPLSVSSLVDLASTVLNSSDSFIKTKEKINDDCFLKEIEGENQLPDENISMQESICQDEVYSKRLCSEDDEAKEKLKQTFLPLSIDIKDPSNSVNNQPLTPSLERCEEPEEKLHSLYKFNLNNSDTSGNISSSHATAGCFKENQNSLDNTFSLQISEDNQIETNSHSSPIIASNIRETHGCATKISDMNKTESENILHEQDHSDTMPLKATEHNLDITQLLVCSKNDQCNEERTDHTDVHSKDDQEEELNTQVSSRENSDEINKCAKSNHYSNDHNFPECLQSEVNVEDLSNQNQQISDSQTGGIEKMDHMPSTINLSTQVNTLHEYHLHENQNHIQHQQFFVHHGQQHLMHHHRHQQHHHQSDLMAYLHHQDQTAMQQPHHIRTYQHYQQQQQRLHQLSYPQAASPQQPNKHGPLTCIDDLMIDDYHEDPSNRYKMLSPTVKHESQDDGYETSAGDVLTPNSHSSSHSMTPQHQIHPVNLLRSKCANMTPSHQNDQDPYNFIDDEINSNIRIVSPSSNNSIQAALRQHNYESSSSTVVTGMRMEDQHMIDADNTLRIQSSNTNDTPGDIHIPKKRGRKKKSCDDVSERPMVDSNLKPILQKERKKHDRFNGMPEEEVSKRTLPDHLANNLDIIIIGINPGLFAAYKGHHYAGPGNHFWKCLYLSGLTHEQMTAEEDYKLLKIGIGFTNMVERATKGSADLTRKEIKEGSRILLEKLKRFRPKIAVFNGKLIFEVFSGKKDFNFGRQQECVEGTDTYMWVMPSSSARCAQLPRAADKVPFYTALKKFRDYLNGLIPHIDDIECVFNDPQSKLCCESEAKGKSPSTCTHFLSPDCQNNEKECLGYNSTSSTIERNAISNMSENQNNTQDDLVAPHSVVNNVDNRTVCGIILQGLNSVNNISPCNNPHPTMSNTGQPEKKKRGRPKKIKGSDGGESSTPYKIRNTSSITMNINSVLNLTLLGANGEAPKKKRGRPKKIKIDNGIPMRSDLITNSDNNSSQAVGTNSINNDIIVTNNVKNIVCGNRSSPNQIGGHQMLTMNNCNQFNTQSMSQQQPLQSQRLFTSPMHSPDTASSYCSIGINVTTTPPTVNANNSNSGNNGSYHHQIGNSGQSHNHLHHNHILQRSQHQVETVSGIYLQSPNDTPQQQSKSPHYTSSHSDLSAEISAAISSDHLCESQSESSPAINAVDYERSESAANDDLNNSHDMRFSSPSSSSLDQHRVERTTHQIQHYHNIYQSGNSAQNYINAHNAARLSEDGRIANTSDDNIGYMVNTPTHASNSNVTTPQPTHNSSQQKNMHVSDVSSKSLSGLESLVEQIPTISDNEARNQLTSIVGPVECRLKSDSEEGYPSPVSGGNDTGSTISGGMSCIYLPTYSNLNSSTPSPSSSVPSNSSIISPHHYPDPTYSAANTCSSTTNSNGNNINYNSLASNFSVSSLTSNSYSPNSYHTNIMATPVVSSPHHVTMPSSGSSMYMDSHLPVAVSTIYPHPYAQHTGYGAYNSVAPPSQPPTLHMPSPNYPYAYGNNSGYPNQSTHHTGHTTPSGYLTTHPSMFDRIKPDIGYGGY